MRTALLASFVAGLAIGVGGARIALIPHLSRKIYDTLLGFSAGVMAAGSVALLGPALRQNGVLTVACGLACGALLVLLLERAVPHLEPHFSPDITAPEKHTGLLMAAALTLHHLPEGLAVGVSFASGAPSLGLIVAAAVALQNIPEGLAVAMPPDSRVRAPLPGPPHPAWPSPWPRSWACGL